MAMRFVPGGINRWRTSVHMNCLVQSGLNILSTTRDISPVKVNSKSSPLEVHSAHTKRGP